MILKCFSKGRLTRYINMATIDLEEPDSEDLEWLKQMINIFVQETGSETGSTILSDWSNKGKNFIKVSIV